MGMEATKSFLILVRVQSFGLRISHSNIVHKKSLTPNPKPLSQKSVATVRPPFCTMTLRFLFRV